jgi:hypothetical protein
MFLLAVYFVLVLAMLFYAGANIANPWLNRAYILSVVAIIIGNGILIMPLFSLPDLHCAKQIVLLGAFGCPVIYGINFFANRSKTLQDYLLFAMLVSFAIYVPLSAYHFPYHSVAQKVCAVLMVINIIYGVYLNSGGSKKRE